MAWNPGPLRYNPTDRPETPAQALAQGHEWALWELIAEDRERSFSRRLDREDAERIVGGLFEKGPHEPSLRAAFEKGVDSAVREYLAYLKARPAGGWSTLSKKQEEAKQRGREIGLLIIEECLVSAACDPSDLDPQILEDHLARALEQAPQDLKLREAFEKGAREAADEAIAKAQPLRSFLRDDRLHAVIEVMENETSLHTVYDAVVVGAWPEIGVRYQLSPQQAQDSIVSTLSAVVNSAASRYHILDEYGGKEPIRLGMPVVVERVIFLGPAEQKYRQAYDEMTYHLISLDRKEDFGMKFDKRVTEKFISRGLYATKIDEKQRDAFRRGARDAAAKYAEHIAQRPKGGWTYHRLRPDERKAWEYGHL